VRAEFLAKIGRRIFCKSEGLNLQCMQFPTFSTVLDPGFRM
jgi:hypothetical protein